MAEGSYLYQAERSQALVTLPQSTCSTPYSSCTAPVCIIITSEVAESVHNVQVLQLHQALGPGEGAFGGCTLRHLTLFRSSSLADILRGTCCLYLQSLLHRVYKTGRNTASPACRHRIQTWPKRLLWLCLQLRGRPLTPNLRFGSDPSAPADATRNAAHPAAEALQCMTVT